MKLIGTWFESNPRSEGPPALPPKATPYRYTKRNTCDTRVIPETIDKRMQYNPQWAVTCRVTLINVLCRLAVDNWKCETAYGRVLLKGAAESECVTCTSVRAAQSTHGRVMAWTARPNSDLDKKRSSRPFIHQQRRPVCHNRFKLYRARWLSG